MEILTNQSLPIIRPILVAFLFDVSAIDTSAVKLNKLINEIVDLFTRLPAAKLTEVNPFTPAV
jgi:hypothetical protein